MNIAFGVNESGMVEEGSIDELRKYVDFVYRYETESHEVCHTELLRAVNNYLAKLKIHNEWQDSGSLDRTDFRYQTFGRIEAHVVAYHLSVTSTKNDLVNLVNECLSLGFNHGPTVELVGGAREVNLRSSFCDRFFYTVEYFIQQMNTHFSFVTDTSAKSKQHYFQKMLEFFEMGDEVVSTKYLVDKFVASYPVDDSSLIKEMKAKLEDKSVPLGKLYEYAAALRNCLHNNGYSNKTLNNLDIGLAQFKGIKQGEYITCQSTFHVLMMSMALTEILQQITQRSIDLFPGKLLQDPFTMKLKGILETKASTSSS
ncbi:hypothetical protein [Microbulbifer sp. JMSA002]|uniref:hypothetical protein n=1 Tax=Microbulbifer sp. JMSA002 TaxID=3243368 RepID=UPI0040398EFE